MADVDAHQVSLLQSASLTELGARIKHARLAAGLTQTQLDALGPGPFEVVVDSTIGPGELSYGELGLPGERSDEVLISAHVCHPSLANDNLSGIVVAAELATFL